MGTARSHSSLSHCHRPTAARSRPHWPRGYRPPSKVVPSHGDRPPRLLMNCRAVGEGRCPRTRPPAVVTFAKRPQNIKKKKEEGPDAVQKTGPPNGGAVSCRLRSTNCEGPRKQKEKDEQPPHPQTNDVAVALGPQRSGDRGHQQKAQAYQSIPLLLGTANPPPSEFPAIRR